MRIVNEDELFIVKVRQALIFPKNIQEDGVFYFWNPVSGLYSEVIHFEQGIVGEYEYYEICDKGKLCYTPKLFDIRHETIKLPLYPKILNTSINNFEEYLAFPFKQIFMYSPADRVIENQLLINDFKNFQENLSKMTLSIKEGNSNKLNHLKLRMKKVQSEVYLNGFYHDMSEDKLYSGYLDRKWGSSEERNKDVDFQKWLLKPSRVTVFEGWDSYVINELLRNLEPDLSVSVCENCGSILDIKKGGHRDRRYCYSEENLDCVRERKRKRQAKYRASKSRKD